MLKDIEELAEGSFSAVYRTGSFADLSTGPRISNTRQITHFTVMGSAEGPNVLGHPVQRICGAAFATEEQCNEWWKPMEAQG